MNFFIRYTTFLFFFSISLISHSQNTPYFSAAKDMGVQIIKNELRVNSPLIIDNNEGVLLGENGQFTINENASLTIATKFNLFQNKQLFFGKGKVFFSPGSVDYIDVTWFGAKPNDGVSDVLAIQKAINTAIMSNGVSVVYFPPGEYCIDSPLLAMRFNEKSKKYGLFNLTLKGHQLPYNNPKGNKGAVSVLKVEKEIPFVLGIQGARGVHIENLVFDGYLPSKTSIEDLINKSSNELYKQNRYAPLSAIVIDPFSANLPSKGAYKGLENYYNNKRSSSKVLLEGIVLQNFPTGIAITPNGKTQQADSVTITQTRFTNLINGLVICQTQSRNIVVDNCLFGRMKYAFNSVDFGEQRGILPEVNNCKISDGVAWIYNANGNVAYGHFNGIYAEGLYGIGYSVINKQPMNFNSCVFKFRPMTDLYKSDFNPCVLRADNASFTGCTFIVGGGKSNIEPILIDVKEATFINCYFDTYPINLGNSLSAKNKSEYINSNLRKNKLKSTTWKEDKFEKTQVVNVSFDSKTKGYFFANTNGFEVNDFVFGLVNIKNKPFIGRPIFTAIGKVYRVKGNKAFFRSSLLEKDVTSIKIIKK